MEVDKILHEPARLVIMSILQMVDELDFTFLQNQTGFTQGNLSSHLSKLEAAGYIVIEKTFRLKRPRTVIWISETGKQALTDYYEQMSGLFSRLHTK